MSNAGEHFIKAQLVSRIETVMKARRLKQAEALRRTSDRPMAGHLVLGIKPGENFSRLSGYPVTESVENVGELW